MKGSEKEEKNVRNERRGGGGRSRHAAGIICCSSGRQQRRLLGFFGFFFFARWGCGGSQSSFPKYRMGSSTVTGRISGWLGPIKEHQAGHMVITHQSGTRTTGEEATTRW